ncbi:hypothetical protein AB1Y20_012678 [Prymnesium parvum]|uniref:Glutathione S-transferase n=1 Tax=Prymnesium parvum TaxID=97485 RepID=A0AB34IKZ8_PRYPA
MLADGTNPEGVDPSPPLNWKSKDDLKDVVLVSPEYSPPSTKIRYHLAYHNVPYKLMPAKEFKRGKSKDTHYMKVPVIFVAGRQVNDSFVILKNLAPVLYGRFEEAWECKITYGLYVAMSVECFEDPNNYATIVRLAGFPSWIGSVFKCAIPLKKAAKRIREKRSKLDEKYGPLRTLKDYIEEFRAAVGSRPFVGGETPNQVDVSFYATVALWTPVPTVNRLLEGGDLTAWLARMKEAMPKKIEGNPKM